MAIVSPVPVVASNPASHFLHRHSDSNREDRSLSNYIEQLEHLEEDDEPRDWEWTPPKHHRKGPLAAIEEEFEFISDESSQTLLVLDYDNTVFPTKHFERSRSQMFADVSTLPPRFRKHLSELDRQMAVFIRDAVRRCEVAVVTAASREWIEFSSAKFMPRLAAVVRALDIEVVCATEQYKDIMETYPQPQCYVATKREAFRDLLKRYDSRRLVSIGDASWERRAALHIDRRDALDASECVPDSSIPKVSVQIIPRSSPAEISTQFNTISDFLTHLLESKESLDLRMAHDGKRSLISHQEDQWI